jgi:hypothetical protein
MFWLKQQFALEPEIPESPDELRVAFAGWMNTAAQRGRFVLVIDGADQLERHDEALAPSWLSANYGNQGMLLFDKGDLAATMNLYKEQERLCRRLAADRGLTRLEQDIQMLLLAIHSRGR